MAFYYLMASSSKKCKFCDRDMEISENGSYCSLCSSASKERTLCHIYHADEDGWKKCDECEKLIHTECILALYSFEVNDASGITCKECIEKKAQKKTPVDVVPNIGASSSVPNLKDCFQLEDNSSSTETDTGELLTDPGRAKSVYNDRQNPDYAMVEGNSETSQKPESGLLFMFEKILTPSDCDPKAGRVLLPKDFAEKYFLEVPGLQRVPFPVEDTDGLQWEFTLRWWLNNRSRKYVLDGIRKCIHEKVWMAGDTLRFYRKLPDGPVIMQLERTHADVSGSDAPGA